MGTKGKNLPAIEGGMPVRKDYLPFHRPSIDDGDIESVSNVVRSGWLTLGPITEKFEAELAAYLGVRNVVAVNSCSAAMFLALKALGVGPGDEVVTSALTFASTIHAIIHAGATPVLADIEPVTIGASPNSIAQKTTGKTRAVLPVHFGGQACRIEEICELAGRRGIYVVEDAAHSFGAALKGRKIGTFGNATAFSFYATKNLTTGEGGCVSTEDDQLAESVRKLSYHGMSRDTWERYVERGAWFYQVEMPGYKSNMSDILSSLGLSQLKRVDDLIARRKAVAQKLRELLEPSGFFELPETRVGNLHTWHLFIVRLKLDKLRIDRDQFIRSLVEENIGCSVHFIPVYRHPFFKQYGSSVGDFPFCEDYYSRCISLPIYPDLGEDDIGDVVAAMNKIAAFYARS